MSIPTSSKRRQSDGITFNKLVVGMLGMVLSICAGLITYIYTTDRAAQHILIKDIAVNVSGIHDGQIINYAQIKNIEARLSKTENSVNSFYKESRTYWGK